MLLLFIHDVIVGFEEIINEMLLSFRVVLVVSVFSSCCFFIVFYMLSFSKIIKFAYKCRYYFALLASKMFD